MLQAVNAVNAVEVEVRTPEPDRWALAVALAVVGPLAVIVAIAVVRAIVS